ncbi:MAG TPA: PDZ domain-containing protein [Tepidisphaeraceae bacterium]
MNSMSSRTVAGFALFAITRLVAGQSSQYTVRVERSDVRPEIIIQASPQFETVSPQPQADPQPRFQKTRGTVVTVGRRVVGEAMGLYVSQVPPAMAAQLRLKPRTGLVVEQVVPGSAAEHAGIQQYDVINRIEDQPVVGPQQVEKIVTGHQQGESVAVEVIREGKHRILNLTVQARDDSKQDSTTYKPIPKVDRPSPTFGYSVPNKEKIDRMSERLRDAMQKEEQKLEELTEKIRAEAEQAKQQIQQLKEQIRREAQQQKEQIMKDLKNDEDQSNRERGKGDGF